MEGCGADIQSWNQLLEVVQFPAKVATMALGALGMMGAILSITGIFGMAAYSVVAAAQGTRHPRGSRAPSGGKCWRVRWGARCGCSRSVRRRDWCLAFLASRVLALIVYQATPRDPLVLAGVVMAMALLGLLATWIPAQRALAVDPMILLREE